MDKETYKKLLARVTPERITEAHQVARFIIDRLNEPDQDAPELSEDLKNVFIATMLIEYGKIKAEMERMNDDAET